MIIEISIGQETMSDDDILGLLATSIMEAIKIGHQDSASTISATSTVLLIEILEQVMQKKQEGRYMQKQPNDSHSCREPMA